MGPLKLSDSLVDLLNGMLDCDPAKRSTFSDVMLHPWMLEALSSYMKPCP